MSSYQESLKSFKSSTLFPLGGEFMRSMPDSLFLGTSVLALMLQSWPLGTLVLAMLETTVIHRLLGGAFSQITDQNEAKPSNFLCMPGIPSVYQLSLVGGVMSKTVFPSSHIFFVVSVIGFVLLSIFQFRPELEELGKNEPEWKLRLPFATIFSALLLCAVVAWRVWVDCDSVGAALASTILALLTALCLFLLHLYLFGRHSLNFLGIPLMVDRAKNGRPLYVCAKQSDVLAAQKKK